MGIKDEIEKLQEKVGELSEEVTGSFVNYLKKNHPGAFSLRWLNDFYYEELDHIKNMELKQVKERIIEEAEERDIDPQVMASWLIYKHLAFEVRRKISQDYFTNDRYTNPSTDTDTMPHGKFIDRTQEAIQLCREFDLEEEGEAAEEILERLEYMEEHRDDYHKLEEIVEILNQLKEDMIEGWRRKAGKLGV